MNLEEITKIKQRIYKVFECLEQPFPFGAQVEELKVDVHAGEEALALGTFCDQLYEYDVKIPRAVIDEIESLGRLLGVDSDCWEDLEASD